MICQLYLNKAGGDSIAGFYLFFKRFYLFIYMTERERAHTQAGREANGQGEAGSLLSREPDAGLDPRTLGS